MHETGACSEREPRGAPDDAFYHIDGGDDLSPSRGIVLAVLLGIALWCVLATTVLFM